MKLTTAAPAPAATSDKRRLAQELLEASEPDIGDEALLTIMDLFKADEENADMYLGFKRDSLRSLWVRRELKKMNFVLPDESSSSS